MTFQAKKGCIEPESRKIVRFSSVTTISIKVKPGSRKESMRLEKDVLIVQVRAPAVDGKANEALIAHLSDALRIPKSQIHIKSGHTSRIKRIELPDEAAQMLKSMGNSRKAT